MTYLGVEIPPGPVPQLAVDARIALDGADGDGAVENLLHLSPRSELPSNSLQTGEKVEEEGVAALF